MKKISITEKVKFVPEEPEYLTIWDDESGNSLFSAGNIRRRGGNASEIRNEKCARLVSGTAGYFKVPIYYSLVWGREPQQKQMYDPLDLDLEPIPDSDMIDDDLF